MIRLIIPIPALILAALVLFAGGCGGGSAEAAPSKAEFIKQADAICKRMDLALIGKLRQLEQSYPGGRATEAVLVNFLRGIILPAIQKEVEDLETLQPPEGDEKKIQAITTGIEAGISGVEEDPKSAVTDLRGPFLHAIKLADEYGFKQCNEPT
jgi:hypothetical protein